MTFPWRIREVGWSDRCGSHSYSLLACCLPGGIASLKAAGPWCGKSVAGFWMATWLALERQTCGQKPLHSLKSHLKPAASSLSPAFAAPDAPRGLHFGSSWCPTMEDYYKLLGVEPLASSKEIGKAPRPLESLAPSSAWARARPSGSWRGRSTRISCRRAARRRRSCARSSASSRWRKPGRCSGMR